MINMELKEEMYVRTKKNGIAKIISKKDVSGSNAYEVNL